MNDTGLIKFKELSLQAIREDDLSLATKLLEALKQEVNLTLELQQFKDQLKWLKFSALDDETCFELLQTKVLLGLRMPYFDMVHKIGLKISFTEVISQQITFMQGIFKALNANTESLGNETIKDWVKGYYNFRSTAALRNSLDEINYVNQSPSTKTLNREEKQFLLTILKITDSVQNFMQEVQAPTTDPRDEELPKDFDYSTLIPGIIREGDIAPALDVIVDADQAALAAPPQQRPTQAAPETPIVRRQEPGSLAAPPLRVPQRTSSIPSVSTPLPSAPVPPKRPPVPAPANSRPQPSSPFGTNVNMQDVLNSGGQQRGGVVFDGQTNVQVEEMSQRIEAERQQKQHEIDQKLEALKKRKT